MQTVLNTIIDNSRAAATNGNLKPNPFPAGTLRHIAHELGQCGHGCVTLYTCQADISSYAVATTDCGQFKCIVPGALANHGPGDVYSTLAGAIAHLRELAINHGARNTELIEA